jgi:hypothetical protein
MMNNDATRFFNLLWASSTPMALWWQTCLKAAETMVAAPQVITHRTARMAQVGSIPTQVDQREFAAMGAEKVVAFSQAWMNAASEIVTFQQQMASTAIHQWWAMANQFNPVTTFTAPWSLMKAPIGLLFTSNRAMSITPRIAHAVVKPIHAKATSNARRLTRKRR